MTELDKLAVMEELWNDLCQDPDAIPSPQWHKGILETRKQEITEGKAKFSPIDTAQTLSHFISMRVSIHSILDISDY